MTVEHWRFPQPIYVDMNKVDSVNVLRKLFSEGTMRELSPGTHDVTPYGYRAKYEVRVWIYKGDTVGEMKRTQRPGGKFLMKADPRRFKALELNKSQSDKTPLGRGSLPILLTRTAAAEGKPMNILRVDGAVLYTRKRSKK